MVGANKDKSLTKLERTILEKGLEDTKHLIILFLGVYGGLRVTEMIQCRYSWLEWHYIQEKKVLAINIPESDRDIKNKRKEWTPKTKSKRTTFIYLNRCKNKIKPIANPTLKTIQFIFLTS